MGGGCKKVEMFFFVKKWKMGVFFCKNVDLSSTQGALCTVSVFFYILHLTYLGVRAHPTHPPAYGPASLLQFRRDLKAALFQSSYSSP